MAPCGNPRQPVMKDDGRLFPVIETLLLGGDSKFRGQALIKKKNGKPLKQSATGRNVLWPTSDVMECFKQMPAVSAVKHTGSKVLNDCAI